MVLWSNLLQIVWVSTSILLCTCLVQLRTLGELWQPKLLHTNWPSCLGMLTPSGQLDYTQSDGMNISCPVPDACYR